MTCWKRQNYRGWKSPHGWLQGLERLWRVIKTFFLDYSSGNLIVSFIQNVWNGTLYRSEFYSMCILGIMMQNISQWIWSKQTKENIPLHCRHGQRLLQSSVISSTPGSCHLPACKTCLGTTNINTTPLAFVGWGLREGHPCVVMFPVETSLVSVYKLASHSPYAAPRPRHYFVKYSPGETSSLYHKPHWKGKHSFLWMNVQLEA